ncbi:MAG TPA: 2Fe-2S iron-sulfur cluster-binding protein [Thermoanaerobaculia bacterium]|nr:2Fe-2S iron-sulfur cluster-binding protein [Thermoanaerobaculia bacterium]
MPKVVFLDQGIRGELPEGTTALEAAQLLGARISSICGGAGACSTCRVECVVNPQNLSPAEPIEDAYDMGPGVRLGCQARILGDVGLRIVKIPRAVLS